MRYRIAITGGIGSGKSQCLNILNKLGYKTFSCDEIYAELKDGEEYVAKIKTIFPQVIENGKINNQKLSKIVFSNEAELKKLNQIAHPIIMKELYMI